MGKRLLDFREKLFIAQVAENRRKMKAGIAASEADLAKMLENSKPDDFNVKMVRGAIVAMKTNLAEAEARHALYLAKVKPPKGRKFK